MGYCAELLCQKLASLIHSVSVYLLLPLFTFISTYIFRLQWHGGGSFKKNDADKNVTEFGNFDNDADEEDGTELHLKFKFPTFEEFSRIRTGTGNLFNSQVVTSSSTSRYEFSSEISSLCASTDEHSTFPVQEFNCNKIRGVEENGEIETMEFAEIDSVEEEDQDLFDEFLSEKNSDGFLSDGDFDAEFDTNGDNDTTVLGNEEENQESQEYYEEIDNVEAIKKPDFLSENDFNENSDSKNDDGFVSIDETGSNGGKDSEKPKPKDAQMPDSGKLESLWEHQELIEQLRMELRKVKATGLPTILEESESPKMMDDLKPWKIDEKFQHEECIGELHKFYKSYTESMRKFDILNYQKMYAIGFLQLKDPFQPQHKTPPPSLKSLVSQSHWLSKHKINGSDPIRKFVNELNGDLEAVYVGQMCLSWEFLHWQYGKVLDLWNSDQSGTHRYNQVAGEFQQFQVLVQRFTEDQPYQGPIIQSYVRSRCVLRNLLQVPVVKEDCLKDKNKVRRRDRDDEHVITSDMLVEIVEESIRIFWQFVRSDKDCTSATINSRNKKMHMMSPEDLKLLIDIRKILQKKEKKLKDILRSENCILRKFRQSKEDDSDQALHFFAQVDMKLVARGLNMSKITRDQLIWCQNKLTRISFVNRKMYVEPAFLLFPC